MQSKAHDDPVPQHGEERDAMRKPQNYTWKALNLGTCYYPEHWDESLWPSDLERMMKNGIRTVRIGEFGWSIMEKDEGQFDFSFFDRFLDLCSSVGMQVIFGTPSATPPAWLTCRYPETLNANVDGVVRLFNKNLGD